MTNQCEHGQLARVCVTCEQAAEIAALREEVARLKAARIQFSDIHSCHDGCTRAGCVNGRLRAQVAGLEVDISAEKLFSTQAMQAAQYMAEERDEAREQVAIYAAERDEARTAWSNRTRELERMEAERDGLREEAINLRAQRDAARADAHTLRGQVAGLEAAIAKIVLTRETYGWSPEVDSAIDAARKGDA